MNDAPAAEDPFGRLDGIQIVRLLWRSRSFLVGVPLLVGALALGVTYLIPPTFTANTVVVPPAQQSSTLSALAGQLGALGGLAGAAGAMKTPADQYIAFLKSRNVTDRIVEKFDLKTVYEKTYMDDTRRHFAKQVRITAGKKDGLISIEVDDHDPRRAANIANELVAQLRRMNTEIAVGEASQRRAFFEEQMVSARNALASAESALNASGVSPTALNAAPQAAVSAVAKLKATLTAQEVRIAAMEGFATEDNPDLKRARLELEALRFQLQQMEQGSPQVTKGGYLEKYREFKYQEMLFELVSKQFELARLDEARNGNIVQVVDVAIAPERKSSPRRAKISIIAAMIGFVAAGAFLVGREMWRGGFTT